MHLPPRKHLAWPLRAGLSAGLASLMSLARSTIFVDAASANVLSAAVFGTVVAIVCSGPTRGSTRAWGIAGGAIMGARAALFGSSLGAVLFSNSLVGVLVLYPRRSRCSPTFGAPHALGRLRKPRPPLVHPRHTDLHRLRCRVRHLRDPPLPLRRLRRPRGEAAIAARRRARHTACHAAYASVDPSREMRRARADTFRRDAERRRRAPRPRRGRAMGAIAFGGSNPRILRGRAAEDRDDRPEPR